MAQPQTVEVTCENCGKTSPFTFDALIEAPADAEQAERLLDGTLFEHTCPHCSSTFGVAVPLLYKNDDVRLMINFAPDFADTAEIERLFEEGGLGGTELSYRDAGFTLRIVGDPNSLREKVLIATSGFDDRIMEVLKLTIAMSATQQTGVTPKTVFFEGSDGNTLSFALVTDETSEPKTVAVGKESYDAIAQDLIFADNAPYYVTPLWALETYKKLANR